MAAPGARGIYVEVDARRTSSDIIGGQNEADKVVYADIGDTTTQYAEVDPGAATSSEVIGTGGDQDKVEYTEINHDPAAVPLPPARPSRPASAGSASATAAPPPRPAASKPAGALGAAGGDGTAAAAAAAASTVEAAAAPGRRLFQLYSGCKAEIIGRELVPTDSAAKWSADDDGLPADGGGGGGGKKRTRRTHFILYTIKITSRFQPEKYDAWQIKRRYSDFHQLHRNLLKATDNAKVLQLAPKRFVKNNLAEEFLNKRQSMLNLYLDALLGVGVLVKHPLTLKFVDA